jgi:hypothetical protein
MTLGSSNISAIIEPSGIFSEATRRINGKIKIFVTKYNN